MASPVRVAVVGAGSVSREFALNHFGPATDTIVSAIVDLDTAKAAVLAADVGSVQAGVGTDSNALDAVQCCFCAATHALAVATLAGVLELPDSMLCMA